MAQGSALSDILSLHSQEYIQAINALMELHKATPPELQDAHTLRYVFWRTPSTSTHHLFLFRNTDVTIGELTRAGQAYFDHTYGDTAESTQALLTTIFPDLGASFLIRPV